MQAATRGLDSAEKLTVLQTLAEGAYGIAELAGLRIDPRELASAAAASGGGGVEWARKAIAKAKPGVRSPEMLTAMVALVRAGEALDPAWDDLVGFVPTDLAREVLAALPKPRRVELALRWARSVKGGQATFLKNVAPLYDLVGSHALAKVLRPWLKLPVVKNVAGVVDRVQPLLDGSERN